MKRASPAPPDALSSSEPDDAEIIAWSVEEPERFAVLFRRHGQEIARYTARRLGAESAEDIAAKRCANYGRRSAPGSMRSWMDDTTQVVRFRDEVPAEIDLAVAERRVMAHIATGSATNRRALPRRRYGRRLAFGGGMAVAALAADVLIVQNLPVRDGTVAKGHRTSPPHTGSPVLRSPMSTADVALNARLIAETKLGLSGIMPSGAAPGTWPRRDAAYLDSLPTGAARLLALINKNNAALYGVLAKLPEVRIGPMPTQRRLS
ncbi:hypothetical protein [Actinoallomurus acaciae]|uniref:Uncharacterized protein n=1 Tax=Actinoallomurus acaciae TaxID=502577 RepID=A0ABV5YAV3_9ACTN